MNKIKDKLWVGKHISVVHNYNGGQYNQIGKGRRSLNAWFISNSIESFSWNNSSSKAAPSSRIFIAKGLATMLHLFTLLPMVLIAAYFSPRNSKRA